MGVDPIALAAVLGFFATSGWMLRTVLGYRERTKRLAQTSNTGAASDERLARLEQAVESIAIEIERVSEGQRFVTKLMSERAQPQLGAEAIGKHRRADTPH